MIKQSTGMRVSLAVTGSLKATLDGGLVRIYAGSVPANADAALGGASMAELQASKQQAQLIGGGYAQQFASAVDEFVKKQTPGAQSPGRVTYATGGATAPTSSSRNMETLPGSQTADGQPRYRLPGQARWYASKQEARDAAWKPQRSAAEPMPENLDAGF